MSDILEELTVIPLSSVFESESLSVSKQAVLNFYMESFKLKKVSDEAVREQ
jgi:hypothetical protein